jgi:hypothetical protein
MGKGLTDKDILMFYKEVEADKFVPGDRYLKRVLRPIWEMFHHRQKKTGFRVSFDLMAEALTRAGYRVHVNAYGLARANPTHPVGVVGFPIILEDWRLPNPALLGPSLYDHPGLKPDLFDDPRFKTYLTLADWVDALYRAQYGDRCTQWFAGIDLERWPDLSGRPKDIDFLIYDKVRWHHDALDKSLLAPIRAELARRGHRTHEVRYKFHDHALFKDLLARSRAMVFVCEHETQGLAYQEAMASGVPILAWDAGVWADPLWRRFQDAAPPASSVPFFSPACGDRFVDAAAFPAALDRFEAAWPTYDPRAYVRDNLSQARSAQIYADAYFKLKV